MILAIQNTVTGEVKILTGIEPCDDIELEDNEVIASCKHEATDELYSDDVYGSRPGEGGISDYFDNTAESESWNDRYENQRNQY